MTETLEIKITRNQNSRLAKTDFDNLPFGRIYTDHMFVADYVNGEWKNFEILPYGDLMLSPSISALHYGQSFFEGIKAYKHADGKVSIFRPDMNAIRFNKSAERLCMPTVPEDVFVQCVAALVDIDRDWVPAQANHSLYIRPFMFATDAYLGVAPSTTYKFMVLTCPVGPYFTKPLRVKIETEFSRSSEGGFGYAKAAGNYGGAMLPSKLAVEQGFDQLLWTDSKEHAYIEELGAANAIFLIDGKLVTPSTRDTILKGVTRDTVLTLAKSWGIEVEERRVSVAEVLEAARNGSLQDAFGAGTAATIAPMGEIVYQGETYTLPNERAFSAKVLTTLNDIRYGRTEDTFGWNHLV